MASEFISIKNLVNKNIERAQKKTIKISIDFKTVHIKFNFIYYIDKK